jgi:hypothetical protein
MVRRFATTEPLRRIRDDGFVAVGRHDGSGRTRNTRIHRWSSELVGNRIFVVGARSPGPRLAVKSGGSPARTNCCADDKSPDLISRGAARSTYWIPSSGSQNDPCSPNRAVRGRTQERNPLRFFTLTVRQRALSLLSPSDASHDPPQNQSRIIDT